MNIGPASADSVSGNFLVLRLSVKNMNTRVVAFLVS